MRAMYSSSSSATHDIFSRHGFRSWLSSKTRTVSRPTLGTHNLVEAENHLRKAVKQWPKYSAARIVLGQVLEAQQKTEEAHEACS
jgi:Tetratricopeptide repeat